MRPLRVSTAIAASAVLLAACAEGPRAEAASARGGESATARALELAADSGIAQQLWERDAAVGTASSGSLDSSTAAESTYLATADRRLDRYFQALILRLKSEAGATPSATEPPAVQRLRAAQRAWVAYRNDECDKRLGDREGAFWAPVRAQCLVEYSTRRAEELADVLEKRRATAPHAQPAKAKSKRSHARTTHRKRTHRR